MTSDIRDAFFETLVDEAERNPKIVILSIDMGAMALKRARTSIADRFFNVGVSEQNAVSVAAGLASRGFIPFVYGICSFVVNRPRAQIRHDAVIAGNPVKIIGSGPGLSYALDGPSHHALDDVQMMRSLPGIEIFTPIDGATAAQAALDCINNQATSYCRLDKGTFPEVSKEMTNHGGIFVRQAAAERWVVTAGLMTHPSLASADGASVASIVKIDEKTVDNLAAIIPNGAVIAMRDESHLSGGVPSLVAEASFKHGKNWRLDGPIMQNRFVQEKWNRNELYDQYC